MLLVEVSTLWFLLLLFFTLHPVPASCSRLLETSMGYKHVNLDEQHHAAPSPSSKVGEDVTEPVENLTTSTTTSSLQVGEKLGRSMLGGQSQHHRHHHRQYHKIPIPAPTTSPVHVVAEAKSRSQSMKRGGDTNVEDTSVALDDMEEMVFHADYTKPKTHPPHSH